MFLVSDAVSCKPSRCATSSRHQPVADREEGSCHPAGVLAAIFVWTEQITTKVHLRHRNGVLSVTRTHDGAARNVILGCITTALRNGMDCKIFNDHLRHKAINIILHNAHCVDTFDYLPDNYFAKTLTFVCWL